MKLTAALLLALLLAACGTPVRPLVDPGRTDMARYEADVAECNKLADAQPGAGSGAAAGALAGVLLGEVLARTSGGMRSRGALAGTGAAVGGLSGASAGLAAQRRVVANCLRGRGYTVLD